MTEYTHTHPTHTCTSRCSILAQQTHFGCCEAEHSEFERAFVTLSSVAHALALAPGTGWLLICCCVANCLEGGKGVGCLCGGALMSSSDEIEKVRDIETEATLLLLAGLQIPISIQMHQ